MANRDARRCPVGLSTTPCMPPLPGHSPRMADALVAAQTRRRSARSMPRALALPQGRRREGRGRTHRAAAATSARSRGFPARPSGRIGWPCWFHDGEGLSPACPAPMPQVGGEIGPDPAAVARSSILVEVRARAAFDQASVAIGPRKQRLFRPRPARRSCRAMPGARSEPKLKNKNLRADAVFVMPCACPCMSRSPSSSVRSGRDQSDARRRRALRWSSMETTTLLRLSSRAAARQALPVPFEPPRSRLPVP